MIDVLWDSLVGGAVLFLSSGGGTAFGQSAGEVTFVDAVVVGALAVVLVGE